MPDVRGVSPEAGRESKVITICEKKGSEMRVKKRRSLEPIVARGPCTKSFHGYSGCIKRPHAKSGPDLLKTVAASEAHQNTKAAVPA